MVSIIAYFEISLLIDATHENSAYFEIAFSFYSSLEKYVLFNFLKKLWKLVYHMLWTRPNKKSCTTKNQKNFFSQTLWVMSYPKNAILKIHHFLRGSALIFLNYSSFWSYLSNFDCVRSTNWQMLRTIWKIWFKKAIF